jgi:hypothetical protein
MPTLNLEFTGEEFDLLLKAKTQDPRGRDLEAIGRGWVLERLEHLRQQGRADLLQKVDSMPAADQEELREFFKGLEVRRKELGQGPLTEVKRPTGPKEE